METVLLPIAVIIFFSFFLLHRNLIRPTAPSSLSLSTRVLWLLFFHRSRPVLLGFVVPIDRFVWLTFISFLFLLARFVGSDSSVVEKNPDAILKTLVKTWARVRMFFYFYKRLWIVKRRFLMRYHVTFFTCWQASQSMEQAATAVQLSFEESVIESYNLYEMATKGDKDFFFFSQSHLGILPIQIIFLQVTCRSSGLMRLCLRTFAMCSTSNRFISATTRNRSHFATHRLGSTAPEGSASATIGRSNSTRPANAIRPPNGQLLQLGKRRTQQWFSDIYRVIATAHTVRESWETKERKKTL